MILKNIPDSCGFVISECGRVFDAEGIERNLYKNGDGYITCSIKKTNGTWITYGVHRLLALAHIPCEGTIDDYDVNHIDCDITNNVKSNLEWVKPFENNSHATLMRKDLKRPLLLATDVNGEQRFFNNIEDFSKEYNLNTAQIWNSIKTGVRIEGWLLKHHKFNDTIPVKFHKTKITKRDSFGKQPQLEIKIKDLDTDAITKYDSLSAAAKEFNTSASHIYQTIYREGGPIKLFRKRYLIILSTSVFPKFDVNILKEARDKGSKEVLVHNSKLNKFFIYPSAAAFMRDSKLSKKSVTVALKNKKLRTIDGWTFLYFDGTAKEKIINFIKSPVL